MKVVALNSVYSRSGSGPVAYVDESYQGFDSRGDRPFYLMSAVVIERHVMDKIREDLRAIAESDYWHSTEAQQTAGGVQRLAELAKYIGTGGQRLILTVQCDIRTDDQDLEHARKECLVTLACALTGLGVRLIVMEERGTTKHQRLDDRTIREAKSAGLLGRDLIVHQTSPTAERLLWTPDVCAFALRRAVTVREHGLFEAIRAASTLVFVGVGPGNEAAPGRRSSSPGARVTVGPMGGGSVIASMDTLVAGGRETQEMAGMRAAVARMVPHAEHVRVVDWARADTDQMT